MKNISVAVLLLVVLGCDSSKKSTSTENIVAQTSSVFEPAIKAIFDAHGGYNIWENMQSMQFELSKGEKHLVNLKSRNVRVESDNWTIGSKGEVVWITPDTTDFKDPRFYHNLYFYFASMPFVLGDPGINYEVVEDKIFKDTTYAAVKISFDNGVGDASNDNYILCYDKHTSRMKWLLYTVTYGDDVPNENFGLINYVEWVEVNGVLMPSRLVWYKYKDEKIVERRSDAKISNWELSETMYEDAIFESPNNARLVD